MESIWEATCELEHFPELEGDITADVAVIGGGMAGILTAYLLTQKGVDTVLLDSGRIGMGVTKGTTGKITSQHSLIYDKITNNFSLRRASQYLRANERALKKFEEIIKSENIECDYEKKNAYTYSLDDSTLIEQEVKAANEAGIKAEFIREMPLPFHASCAAMFPDQAQFHPLKFIEVISRKLRIYENTRALDISEGLIETQKGKISANKIVVATHFPFINTHGMYFARMYQSRSYLVAVKIPYDLKGMYLDHVETGYSLRNYGEYVLIAGADHNSGQNKAGGKYAQMEKFAHDLFPDGEIKYKWSAEDCMSLDSIPYIGHYSRNTPYLYVATGFNKWGMSGSMVSAMILSDMITGKRNPDSPVFSTSRFKMKASAENLLSGAKESVKGLTKQIAYQPTKEMDDIEKGHGAVISYEGQKTGVYKDDSGRMFFVTTRCPHLGCELEWNPDEKTWDCPCHGSSFSYEGNVIYGPAQKGLNE